MAKLNELKLLSLIDICRINIEFKMYNINLLFNKILHNTINYS